MIIQFVKCPVAAGKNGGKVEVKYVLTFIAIYCSLGFFAPLLSAPSLLSLDLSQPLVPHSHDFSCHNRGCRCLFSKFVHSWVRFQILKFFNR